MLIIDVEVIRFRAISTIEGYVRIQVSRRDFLWVRFIRVSHFRKVVVVESMREYLRHQEGQAIFKFVCRGREPTRTSVSGFLLGAVADCPVLL